ncbi:uncharacterized protein LOC141691704 [Apium graveolens]|uniref:uncharacterized protein LOC141691704 n=1 Tax=Apium graveolens TaxID=4045 RepID=UPI003D7A8645
MNGYWCWHGIDRKWIRWKAWERMCVRNEAGGLGFKCLRNFNLSMLAKQAWRLLNNDNPLVTACMKAKYYPTRDFLNAKIGVNPSFMWRSLIAAQYIIRKGCRKKIGDGTQTMIWEVPWLPHLENGYLTTEMPGNLAGSKVCSFMEINEKKWDDEVLLDICNERDQTHILFECDFAKQVWLQMGFQDLIQSTSPGENVFEFMRDIFDKCTSVQCEWKQAKQQQAQVGMNGGVSMVIRRWERPVTGWVKVNIDAVLFEDVHSTGMGIVVRDAEGKFLMVVSRQRDGLVSPREAEALCLKEALSWLKDKGLSKCIFETDSQLLARACKGVYGRSYFHSIVSDCVELFKQFSEVLVSFVYSLRMGCLMP